MANMDFSKSSDPVVSAYAKRLPILAFNGPMPYIPPAKEKFHGVTLNFITRCYMVRFSLCGRQYVLGVIRRNLPDSLAKAVRWADMILLHFWKYRRLGGPTDPDFNLSLTQARFDLGGGCPEGAKFLQAIEEHLLKNGRLMPRQPSVAESFSPDIMRAHILRAFRNASRTLEQFRPALENSRAKFHIAGLIEHDLTTRKLMASFETVDLNTPTDGNDEPTQ